MLPYSEKKEASAKSPTSQKVMFLDWTIFYFQSEFGAETLILLKDDLRQDKVILH